MTYKMPVASNTPACQVGSCADSPQLASEAVWLLPQMFQEASSTASLAMPRRRYRWRFILVCEGHAHGWWDGDEHPPGLPHYRLVEAPVVAHSPQWPVAESEGERREQ